MQNRERAGAPVLTAYHDGGLRFVAEIRGHRVETDQPAYGGGADSAAMPLELLSAALGTCVVLYVHQYLATRSLPTDGLQVAVTSAMAEDRPRRIGRYDVEVRLPDGIPAELRPMIERVAASCPAHATLAHPPQINFALTTEGSAAGAARVGAE